MKIAIPKVSTNHSFILLEREITLLKNSDYRVRIEEADRLAELMNPENNGRILPCCEKAFLIGIAKGQLIDEGFSPIESNNISYTISGEKFMDLKLAPKRYAHYLYVIIKIDNEPLTEEEEKFYDYVSALPNDKSPVVIDCIICRVEETKVKGAMNGENVNMVLW